MRLRNSSLFELKRMGLTPLRHRKWLVGLFLLLSALLLSCVSVITKPHQLDFRPMPSVSPTSVDKGTPARAWKVLESPKLGFTTEYPPDWEVVDAGKFDLLLHSPDFLYEGETLQEGAEISISRLNNPQNWSLLELTKREASSLGGDIILQDAPAVGGLPAVKLMHEGAVIAVFVGPTNSQFFRFDLKYAIASRHAEFEQVLNAMLHQFRVLSE
jgi:hypothetical protein